MVHRKVDTVWDRCNRYIWLVPPSSVVLFEMTPQMYVSSFIGYGLCYTFWGSCSTMSYKQSRQLHAIQNPAKREHTSAELYDTLTIWHQSRKYLYVLVANPSQVVNLPVHVDIWEDCSRNAKHPLSRIAYVHRDVISGCNFMGQACTFSTSAITGTFYCLW